MKAFDFSPLSKRRLVYDDDNDCDVENGSSIVPNDDLAASTSGNREVIV